MEWIFNLAKNLKFYSLEKLAEVAAFEPTLSWKIMLISCC